nr:hypothetical protein [Escherichia coli]
GTADRNRSHWSTSKTPSYTKSVSWQHYPKTSEASGRFNAEDLLRMRKGNVPLNYNVHHKLSLDDGGTNDFENLVLIENEPYHKVFTNMQSRIAKGILVGESKITPWAIPSGSIYPPMKNIMDHTK